MVILKIRNLRHKEVKLFTEDQAASNWRRQHVNLGWSRKCSAFSIDLKCIRNLIIENTVPNKWQLGSNLFSPRIFNPIPPDSMSKCQTIKTSTTDGS